jgi:hypothetical protein
MKKTKAFLSILNSAPSALIIFMTLVGVSSDAWGLGGFLEPYVGFGKLQVAVKDAKFDDFDDKDIADGFQLGIKGGMTFDKKYFLGADYNTAGPYEFGRTLNKGEWTERTMGIGAGMDYEVVRFWAGYYFDDSFDDSKNTTKYQGTAAKFGFGLVLGKSLHANFDLILHFMKTSTKGGVTTDVSNSYKAQTANVSISMPVNFGN